MGNTEMTEELQKLQISVSNVEREVERMERRAEMSRRRAMWSPEDSVRWERSMRDAHIWAVCARRIREAMAVGDG